MNSFAVIVPVFSLIATSLSFNFEPKAELQFTGNVIDIDAQQPRISTSMYKSKINSSNFFTNFHDPTKHTDIIISPSTLEYAWLSLMKPSVLDTLTLAFLRDLLEINTPGIEMSTWQAMFVNTNEKIDESHQGTLQNIYGALPLNFDDAQNTTTFINNRVKIASRKLIEKSIKGVYVGEANLLLISFIYFRGQWKIPFDSSQTQQKNFHDMNGIVSLKVVDMMSTEGSFKYIYMSKLNATVLELPFGTTERVSMLVVLPKLDVSINEVIRNVDTNGLGNIIKRLSEVPKSHVRIYLPRFTTTTHLLQKKELFNGDIVDIMHNAKIMVNEYGMNMEPASVATAKISNGTCPELLFDRPFLYLIADKLVHVVGKFTNENVEFVK